MNQRFEVPHFWWPGQHDCPYSFRDIKFGLSLNFLIANPKGKRMVSDSFNI